jgi:acetolactate synthase-1/2/3 large subunit
VGSEELKVLMTLNWDWVEGEKVKLADYVVDFIVKEGVHHIFELVGGAITHLLDSVYRRKDITCISMHHEQAAAFAAEAYVRVNGNLGVALATSGPGALNLVTGIGSCYFDSVPCLFITGQVNTYEYKFERPIRQLGFQETDIVGIVRPITKYCAMITQPETIRYHLEKAVFLAQNGRPGPVLLDLPMDVQRAEIEPQNLPGFWGNPEFLGIQDALSTCPIAIIDRVIQLIAVAKRPLILAGGGVRIAGAVAELRKLIAYTGIPVVTSLMGLDVIQHEYPIFCGMIGIYANRYSNMTIANSDFLLILGSRLDSRQTGTQPVTFARAAYKVHVDIDPGELGSKVRSDLLVHCHLKDFLEKLNVQIKQYSPPNLSHWYQIIRQYQMQFATFDTPKTQLWNNPYDLLQTLSRCADDNHLIILDVGQNQMWAAQSFRLKARQRMLISGGMGAMGFGIAAAIGASFAAPDRNVMVIAGDGGIQVNLQELDTIISHRLPIKIFIFNNHCLGMVRQFQDCYFEGRRQSTVWGYHCPDLINIAAAYGWTTFTIKHETEAAKTIHEAFQISGPVFINIKLGVDTTVNPKLLVNKPLEDMSPPLDREELRKMMLIDLVVE